MIRPPKLYSPEEERRRAEQIERTLQQLPTTAEIQQAARPYPLDTVIIYLLTSKQSYRDCYRVAYQIQQRDGRLVECFLASNGPLMFLDETAYTVTEETVIIPFGEEGPQRGEGVQPDSGGLLPF